MREARDGGTVEDSISREKRKLQLPHFLDIIRKGIRMEKANKRNTNKTKMRNSVKWLSIKR